VACARTTCGAIFDRLLEAASIDRLDAQGRQLDIHAMRHSAATRFARTGMPLMHAQFVLGHSDPKLAARVYSHLGVEDLRGAVAAMERRPIAAGLAG
jgi:integrase